MKTCQPERAFSHQEEAVLIDPVAVTFTAILPFILVGFAAQIVDGALGMAFGVISSTLLLSLGVPPAVASAGVHTVEIFTTGVSGVSHGLCGNVNWPLLTRLALPGMLGGATGAYLLTQIDGTAVRPLILGYLALIGLYLVRRGFAAAKTFRPPRVVGPLALAGGFLDAAGGGGWGPVVTGNLLAQGGEPRQTIGTVNAVEFIVTLTISATFILNLGWAAFTMAVAGLLIGGVAAAPLGAMVARRAPTNVLLVIVGMLLVATSVYGVFKSLWS